MGCSNSREFEIEDATLNPKMLEEDALARIHADMTMWTCCKNIVSGREGYTVIANAPPHRSGEVASLERC